MEILHEWRQKFLDLEWMVDSNGPPNVVDDDTGDEEHLRRMRTIYRQYGWPNNFQATACRDALATMPEDDSESDEDDEDDDDGDDDDDDNLDEH